MAYLNEKYAYNIQKYNYQNGILVRRQLENSGFNLKQNQCWKVFNEQIKCLVSKELFEDRMKHYCDLRNSSLMGTNIVANTIAKSHPEIEAYYDLLGVDKIKALNYKEINLKKEMRNQTNFSLVLDELKKDINIGDSVPAKKAKELLGEIYLKLGITCTAKGSDLKKWYDINKRSKWINNEKVKVYEIARIKENFS